MLLLIPAALFGQTLDVGVDTKVYIRLYDSTTFLPKTGVTAASISCDCVQNDGTLTSFTGAASGTNHDIVEINGGNSVGFYSVELVGASDLNVHGWTRLGCKGSGFISPALNFNVVEDPSYQRSIVGDIAIPDDVWDVALNAHTTAGTSGLALANSDTPNSGILSVVSAIDTMLGTPASTDLSTDIANIKALLAHIGTGTAQGGTPTTITLDATDTALNNGHAWSLIRLVAGPGAGQTGLITSYNSTSKVATVICQQTSSGQWVTIPVAGSTKYVTIPDHR